MKRQDPRVRSANAYSRLAAKASKAGNYTLAAQYRQAAEQLLRAAQRQAEYMRSRQA